MKQLNFEVSTLIVLISCTLNYAIAVGTIRKYDSKTKQLTHKVLNFPLLMREDSFYKTLSIGYHTHHTFYEIANKTFLWNVSLG